MGMTAGDRLFVDANILVFQSIRTAPKHAAARARLEATRQDGIILFTSRQCLREFVATVTRPQTFMNPLPPADVVTEVRWFERVFKIAEDGAGVTNRLLALLGQVAVGGKQVHDANIVATMQDYNVPNLLTDNTKDFARYHQWITVIPL